MTALCALLAMALCAGISLGVTLVAAKAISGRRGDQAVTSWFDDGGWGHR